MRNRKCGGSVLQGRAKIFCRIAVAALLVTIAMGCQTSARISWEPPAAQLEQKGSLEIVEFEDSRPRFMWREMNPDMVGVHTFTAMALPIMPAIATDGSVWRKMNAAVKDAFDAAGYTVSTVSGPPVNGPYLAGTLTNFNYWSYMWLWPIMLEGGKVGVRLELKGSDGRVLWAQNFSRKSFWVTPGGAFGYNGKIKSAMTRIVRDINEAALSEEFRNAIGRAGL